MGVQCVDCVAEAAAQTRQPRTVLGGQVRAGAPVVTITIIVINIAAYVLQQVVPGFTSHWIFSPRIDSHDYVRMLSTAFLHASITHIGLNMVTLWFVGPFLENALGRIRYAVLYLVCAFGGSVGVVVIAQLTHSWPSGVVGASGAIFGLFGAVFAVMRRMGGDIRSILTLIVLNLVLGFVVANISWQAHVGGLVTGAVLAAAYAYAPRKWQKATAWVAPIVVVALLVLALRAAYAAAGL
ncbi:rhomboid family intramembrane serine protease [Cellulomonas alba]|uniref:rhomboid family intramembrane serine protease n=1 Tax=Cellulomonas alba TaxID=3053467 RepID=UPI002DD65239|nr:rhomboid family intramembrane serine protease [Cellulomonas alba]